MNVVAFIFVKLNILALMKTICLIFVYEKIITIDDGGRVFLGGQSWSVWLSAYMDQFMHSRV